MTTQTEIKKSNRRLLAQKTRRVKLKPTDQIRKEMEWPTQAFGHTEFNANCEAELIHILLGHIDSLEARIKSLEDDRAIAAEEANKYTSNSFRKNK